MRYKTSFRGVNKKNKIVWALIGDEKVTSSRIHGINIHNKLVENGYLSLICH
jgi:hypothetical protein